MLGFAECWEPHIFFIQDFTPVNICYFLCGAVEKTERIPTFEKNPRFGEPKPT